MYRTLNQLDWYTCLGSGIGGPAGPGENEEGCQMTLDALQTVTLFLAHMGDRNLDAALELLAEDVVFENPPMSPPANRAVGRAIIRERHTRLFERVVAVSWPVSHIVANGNVVMTERTDKFWFAPGTFPGGDYMGCHILSLWYVEHGQIKLWRDMYDYPSTLGQIGTDLLGFSKAMGYAWARE
jgi:limonene-1,2-epoxide hydrolase